MRRVAATFMSSPPVGVMTTCGTSAPSSQPIGTSTVPASVSVASIRRSGSPPADGLSRMQIVPSVIVVSSSTMRRAPSLSSHCVPPADATFTNESGLTVCAPLIAPMRASRTSGLPAEGSLSELSVPRSMRSVSGAYVPASASMSSVPTLPIIESVPGLASAPPRTVELPPPKLIRPGPSNAASAPERSIPLCASIADAAVAWYFPELVVPALPPISRSAPPPWARTSPSLSIGSVTSFVAGSDASTSLPSGALTTSSPVPAIGVEEIMLAAIVSVALRTIRLPAPLATRLA
jgi:hypothetical protein